jgi:4-hydroxybenzoate polyprenyltransferase
MSARAREAWAFLVHLRLPYQLLILPGGYLLGGLFAPALDVPRFCLQFLVVHVLLNGGVTAYNSYWDEDEGPVGGLERPPKMAPWMHPASLLVQAVGLVAILPVGPLAAVLYASTMVLSVLYSAPGPRWKGRPLLSLVAVGVGTGTNTFLLGVLAAGGALTPRTAVAACGVALLLLSLYPASQIFQRDADRARGDRTFAVAFGLDGVRRFFAGAFPVGLALASVALAEVSRPLGALLALTGGTAGLASGALLFRLRGEPEEYRPVMRLKLLASLGFVIFAVLGHVLR